MSTQLKPENPDKRMTDYQKKVPYEQRIQEARTLRTKYPDKVPVILQKAEKSDVPDLDKKRFLVPCDSTVAHLLVEIRKRIKLTPEKSIFLFINNALPPTSELMSKIDQANRDEDGFVYVVYSGDHTFGNK